MQLQINQFNIDTFLNKSESDILEFKCSLVAIDKICNTIASFSNTKGGIIIIGVNDDKSIVGVPNIDLAEIELKISYYVDSADYLIYSIEYQENNIIIIDVQKNENKITVVKGLIWSRKNNTNRLMNFEDIKQYRCEHNLSNDEYYKLISDMNRNILKISTELIEIKNELKRKNDSLIKSEGKRKFSDIFNIIQGLINIMQFIGLETAKECIFCIKQWLRTFFK